MGRPYKNLLSDLVKAPALKPFDLRHASRLPPKEPGALNIEGLCATPDHQLLIGFRNPVPQGKALLVPLENPELVLLGDNAKFGNPILLDLGGLGIRDMACVHGRYLLIAGPYDGAGKSKLFTWSGGESPPKHLRDIDLKGFNAEALIVYEERGLGEVQLLSDDSSHQAGHLPCKQLSEDARHFRSIWVSAELKHHKDR